MKIRFKSGGDPKRIETLKAFLASHETIPVHSVAINEVITLVMYAIAKEHVRPALFNTMLHN